MWMFRDFINVITCCMKCLIFQVLLTLKCSQSFLSDFLAYTIILMYFSMESGSHLFMWVCLAIFIINCYS